MNHQIREKAKRSTHLSYREKLCDDQRVKTAYGEEYVPMMMYDRKRDVTNLLNEAETLFIRECLRQKQDQQ